MNKEYMLQRVRERIQILLQKYNDTFEHDLSMTYSKGSLRVIRAKYKQDICTLTLIEELLIGCQSIWIENPDSLLAFERITGDK